MPYVIHYFIARKAADGLQSADFRSLSDQSYGLCSKTYVREAEVAVDSDELFFRCKVRATMKSGVRYNVKIVLGRQSGLLFNTILYTECSCPAGAAPNATCTHIAAVCYGLDEYSRFGSFVGCTSSTSQLCKWSGPPTKRRVSELDFTSLHPDAGTTQVASRRRVLHDPRPAALQHPKCEEESMKLYHIVASTTTRRPDSSRPSMLDILAPAPVFAPVIASAKPSQTELSAVNDLVRILRSSRAYQSSSKNKDAVLGFCTKFLSLLCLSKTQQHAIEFRTRGQAGNKLWQERRYGRLTASNFSAVVKRQSPFAPLVTRPLSPTPFRSSAVDWGRQNEAVARKEYAVKNDHVTISERGLHLMANGFIGACPDGVLHDPSMPLGSQQGLLEIKCPYSARHYTPLDACTSLETFFCQLSDTGDIRLKRNQDPVIPFHYHVLPDHLGY